jgi:hypothetical protein
MGNLPVSLASLYDKVNHTEPGILQALVQSFAQRLAPVMGFFYAKVRKTTRAWAVVQV